MSTAPQQWHGLLPELRAAGLSLTGCLLLCLSNNLIITPCEDPTAVQCVAESPEESCPDAGFALELYPGGFFRPPPRSERLRGHP